MPTIKVNVELNLPTAMPPKLLQLLSFNKKSELENFCKGLSITKEEFFALVLHCGQCGYLHQIAYHRREPEHLRFDPTKIWPMGTYKPGDKLHDADAKEMNKTTQLLKDRRLMTAHLFVDSQGRWHLFYFDQRDTSGDHWRHGPHVHFANYLWPEFSLERVRTVFSDPNGSLNGTIHIRFIEDDMPRVDPSPPT
jgi:hypothetical protein